jgi:hypothetical protein
VRRLGQDHHADVDRPVQRRGADDPDAAGGGLVHGRGEAHPQVAWDAADLRPLGGPLRVSDNAGAFATFSADGARIVALDATSRITTWDATVGTWLARACSSVGHRDFTPEESTLFSITPAIPRPCA